METVASIAVRSTDILAGVITHETDDSGKRDFLLKKRGSASEVTCAHCRDHGLYIHVHGARGATPGSTLLNTAIFEFPQFLLIHDNLVADGMISIIKRFGENPASQNEFSPKVTAPIGAYLDA